MRRLAAAVLALALLGGCARGCGKNGVAEVTKPKGDVRRDTASSVSQWQPAGEGATLEEGDGLRTGPASAAAVRLAGGGSIAVASETTIRFTKGAPSKGGARPHVAVEAGEATLEANDGALAVETSVGVAQIESGGKLRMTSSGAGPTRFEVTVGTAHLETSTGDVALAPGRAFEVSVGGAVVEREPGDALPDAGAAVATADAASAVAPVASGPLGLQVHGAGVRTQTRGEGEWKPIAEGAATATAGDVLDVPKGSSVDLSRGPQKGRLVGAGRYVVGEDGGPLVRASSGHIELEASSTDVLVEAPGGVIVARTAGPDGKSRISADVSATGTKVSVAQGQGEVRGASGRETLRAGESATLSAKGALAVSGRSVERADFTVRAGESFTVRDPRPPTAVGFDFSSACPAAGLVTLGDGTVARGDKRAAVLLPAGRHDYSVRCVSADGVDPKAALTGSVTVVADAARADLARLPPSTVVDTDGRRYTLLYQNLLPSVVVRWPNAPPASGYVLLIGSQRLKSTTPKQSLASGTVGEGTHNVRFESEDGSKRSGDTTLVIKFDNAAPAASVREPIDGAFKAGDSVRVSGVVVEGWSASINGLPVPLDPQKRFTATASVPAGENSIVLRLSHPKRGTVYYVRHASSR